MELFLTPFPFCDKIADIPVLNLFPGPGGFSQKYQAGLDAWLADKTLDPDLPAHFLPAIFLQQTDKNHLKSDAMQRIIRLLTIIHMVMAFAPFCLLFWPSWPPFFPSCSWQVLSSLLSWCFVPYP